MRPISLLQPQAAIAAPSPAPHDQEPHPLDHTTNTAGTSNSRRDVHIDHILNGSLKIVFGNGFPGWSHRDVIFEQRSGGSFVQSGELERCFVQSGELERCFVQSGELERCFVQSGELERCFVQSGELKRSFDVEAPRPRPVTELLRVMRATLLLSFDRMCMALAMIFNSITSGAQNDLEKVTKIAYAQMRVYGMSPIVGLLSFPDQKERGKSPFSNKFKNIIDLDAYYTTQRLLRGN